MAWCLLLTPSCILRVLTTWAEVVAAHGLHLRRHYFQPNRVIKGPAQLLWVPRSSGLSGGVVLQGLYTFSPWNCCCCVQVQPISSGWDSSAIPVPLAPPRAVWATSAQRSSYFCHCQTTSPPSTNPPASSLPTINSIWLLFCVPLLSAFKKKSYKL